MTLRAILASRPDVLLGQLGIPTEDTYDTRFIDYQNSRIVDH
jgi:hypothetical protein